MTVIHILIGMFNSNPIIPQYLNTIELAICVGVCVSHVLDSQLLNGWTYGHGNCRVCSRTRSHDSVIFFAFFGLIFF